jgi:hypothetical protein
MNGNEKQTTRSGSAGNTRKLEPQRRETQRRERVDRTNFL